MADNGDAVVPVQTGSGQEASEQSSATAATAATAAAAATVAATAAAEAKEAKPTEATEATEAEATAAEATAAEATEEVPKNTVITRFNYRDVDKALQETYHSNEANGSMICDIIVLYLKANKTVYAEAKTFCEQKLHMLMLPSIFLTVLGSVINLVLKDYTYGTTIVSSLNAITAFLLAVVNYLKLDARAEAHRTTAYKLDKLESDLMFNSGKMMFVKDTYKSISILLDETHKHVKEIKETNPFVLPEHIRYHYPILCGMNVFTEVKDIQTQEMRMTNQLKDLYNDTKMAKDALKNSPEDADLQDHVKELETKHRGKLDEIVKVRTSYKNINDIFEKELRKNRNSCSKRIQLCGCLKV